MKLDNLISKYLDGELTHDEDAHLRSFLSEDDDAKVDFDSAVLLHAAMKEDAESILAPDDVAKETEDNIMMAILSRREVGVTKLYQRRRYYSYAAVILLFLIGTFYRIYDSQPINNAQGIAEAMIDIKASLIQEQYRERENEMTMEVIDERFSNVNHDLARNNEPNSRRISRASYVAIDNDMHSFELNNMPLTDAINEAIRHDIAHSLIASNSEMAADELMMESKVSPTSNFMSPVMQSYSHSQPILASNRLHQQHSLSTMVLSGSQQYFDFYKNSSSIQMSSFLGTEIANYGIKTNEDMTVSHFSQSIAYSLDNNNLLGVEVGLSKYSYDEVTTIHYSAENVERIDNGMEIEGYQFGDYISREIVFDRNKEVVWASAFYERQWKTGDLFAINGRFGLGASSDGALAYVRLFTKYRLLNGIYLTAGAEGRLFYLDIPELSSSVPTMKSAVMIAYGLQFVF